jgi:hypothetical protein
MSMTKELRDIWLHLGNLLIGPEWRLYVHNENGANDGLYLQHRNPETKGWVSLARVTTAGTISVKGTVTGSATLVDVGN